MYETTIRTWRWSHLSAKILNKIGILASNHFKSVRLSLSVSLPSFDERSCDGWTMARDCIPLYNTSWLLPNPALKRFLHRCELCSHRFSLTWKLALEHDHPSYIYFEHGPRRLPSFATKNIPTYLLIQKRSLYSRKIPPNTYRRTSNDFVNNMQKQICVLSLLIRLKCTCMDISVHAGEEDGLTLFWVLYLSVTTSDAYRVSSVGRY